MKTKHLLLVSALMVMATVAGCKSKNDKNLNDRITWVTISDSLSYTDPTMEAMEDSMLLGPAFNATVSILVPSTKDRELKAVVDSIRQQVIYRMVDIHAGKMTPEEAIKKHITTLLDEHKAGLEEAKAMSSHDHEAMESSLFLFVMQHTTVDSLAFNEKNLISLVTSLEDYTGGAHGLSSISTLNYDLALNKRITFNALFTPNAEEVISQMVQEKLMQKFGVSKPEDLEGEGIYNYDNAKVSDNFYFSHEGVTFFFNPYEIGAYFLGTIEITISYDELKGYLQEPYQRIAQE